MSMYRNTTGSDIHRSRRRGVGISLTRRLICGGWAGILGGAIAANDVLYGPPMPELQRVTTADSIEVLPAGASAPEFPAQVSANGDALMLLQLEKERYFVKVQGQILELGRRWNAQAAAPVVRPATDDATPSPPAASTAMAGSSKPTAGSPNTPPATPPAGPPGSPNVPPPTAVTTPPAATPAPREAPAPDIDLAIPAAPHVLVDGPIDRLGIADTLLATGHTDAAARMYAEMNVGSAAVEERAWIQFQLAASDRRLGRVDAAQQRYRELIAAGEPRWIVDLARWWLQAIDDRKRLTENTAKLTNIVQQLTAEVTSELQLNAGSGAGADSGVRR